MFNPSSLGSGRKKSFYPDPVNTSPHARPPTQKGTHTAGTPACQDDTWDLACGTFLGRAVHTSWEQVRLEDLNLLSSMFPRDIPNKQVPSISDGDYKADAL